MEPVKCQCSSGNTGMGYIKDICMRALGWVKADSELSEPSTHYENGPQNVNGGLPRISPEAISIDLSHNSFSGPIPHGWENCKYLTYLNLRSNRLSGELPIDLSNLTQLEILNLGKNEFSGTLPTGMPPNLQVMILRSNQFEGNIPLQVFNLSFLFHLDLAQNKLSRSIPHGVYNMTQMTTFKQGIIDPFNLLSTWSNVEDCCAWEGVECHNTTGRVTELDLYELSEYPYKTLKGGIPHISPEATNVDLSYNFFSGPIPTDLSNLTQLLVLNLEKNKFSGTLPVEMPSSLEVMILRSNQLEGNIPPQIFNLSDLFLLDLSHNKLSGSIPHCVYNLTQMITEKINLAPGPTIGFTTKGQYYELLMHPERRTIDLSANNLSGEIPLQLFRLIQVQTLNLSRNHFNGTVDKTIGSMKNLESLDFSNNNLSGEIPQSMAGLSFLGYLNLSYNKFIGKIPIGTQLQGFNASSYIGNAELCGAPLTKCITNEENPEKEKQHAENGEDDLLRKSLYLGMGVGFAVGFWGICGSLFLVRKWRHSYFQFLDQKADQLYVTFTVMINNLRRSAATTS
ncbi:hypothetical protein VNO77_42903 [Canavalia gladiata]|uniref:Leucine-rich repeat-containing N-terminal plant-type domain-containing protein n=1 Tax=Canavalia gladiata TaxID=3824 RepID=A0AAN9JT90_CANGL